MRKIRRSFSIWKTVQSYWKEAFPDEVDIEAKLQQRREIAQKQRELEEKILEGKIIADEHIPEWKRGALVKVETQNIEEEDEEDIVGKLKDSLFGDKKGHDELGFFEEEITEMQSYHENLKENIVNRFSYTDNLVLNKVKYVYDKVKVKLNSDVYIEMRRRYPDFDIEIFEEELKYTFVEMYNRYLKHDLEYIQKVCGADAYATFSSLIQSQKKQSLVHKYTDILNVADFRIDSGMLTENKTPLFVCTIKLYEIECLVDKNDPDKVVEGNLGWPTYRDFGIFVIPHPKPDIESVGHEWVIIRAEDRAKNLQLENKADGQKEDGKEEDKKDTK